jgi:hypothetical protein
LARTARYSDKAETRFFGIVPRYLGIYFLLNCHQGVGSKPPLRYRLHLATGKASGTFAFEFHVDGRVLASRNGQPDTEIERIAFQLLPWRDKTSSAPFKAGGRINARFLKIVVPDLMRHWTKFSNTESVSPAKRAPNPERTRVLQVPRTVRLAAPAPLSV